MLGLGLKIFQSKNEPSNLNKLPFLFAFVVVGFLTTAFVIGELTAFFNGGDSETSSKCSALRFLPTVDRLGVLGVVFGTSTITGFDFTCKIKK